MISIDGVTDKSVLLIDDEEEILFLLKTVLQKEGFQQVYKATTGEEGIRLADQFKPDVIVLDIMLPDMDGYNVCKRIRESNFVPIIFLSAKSDDIDKLLGLGIGGDDYVTKPFSPKEVAFRVKAQLRRQQQYVVNHDQEDSNVSFGDIEVNRKLGEVKKAGRLVELRAKEYQLLTYLIKHPNQILSKQTICEKVWGEDYFGFDNTIMVHIRHLREKLEDNPSKPNYIKTVKGLGYKLLIPRGTYEA
ncbi:DNA-binding response regulator [Bacillus sp. HMF5848]|uniref:response regulator transcription factor n=1 Tax=Bacillus sp. HMF5848 TaxID=2495421 RepID=UPI000F7769FE|nr:response regulator transcription factor [Bacillus sp. HMF5848]RSK26785.1 DNA-binding response regulator [Bacillus sp. HMF5848]